MHKLAFEISQLFIHVFAVHLVHGFSFKFYEMKVCKKKWIRIFLLSFFIYISFSAILFRIWKWWWYDGGQRQDPIWRSAFGQEANFASGGVLVPLSCGPIPAITTIRAPSIHMLISFTCRQEAGFGILFLKKNVHGGTWRLPLSSFYCENASIIINIMHRTCSIKAAIILSPAK